jgi:hypothetical protein
MGIGVFALALTEIGYRRFLIYLGFNLVLLLLQLSALTLYYSVKKRQIVNIVNEYIGFGDILFFIFCCGLFAPVNFIFFQILSLTLILLVYVTFFVIKKPIHQTIPLAGALALIINLVFLSRLVGLNVDFYDDLQLLQLLM